MKNIIAKEIADSIAVKQMLLDDSYLQAVDDVADMMAKAYECGNKVLLCGNGGSASDALHIEGELIGRFVKERKGLAAIALGAGLASITSVANDYGYTDVFRRQVEAHGKHGDVLLAFSTSGNSDTVISAVEEAKRLCIKSVGFLGKDGGKLKKLVDIALVVPSDVTARIQECHILIGHILCGLVESRLFGK